MTHRGSIVETRICGMNRLPLFLSLLLLASFNAPKAFCAEFLKLNQFFLMYTDPIYPHIDSNGDFLVSLKPFARLIGASVTENGKDFIVNWEKRTARFSNSTKTDLLNGRPFPL